MVKLFDDLANLSVRQERVVVRQPQSAIENRVAVEDHRFRAVLATWTGEAAGVGQLKPDQEFISSAHGFSMRLNQRFAEVCEFRLRRFGDEKLVGVGAAVVPHRDRLPTPDELGSALSESTPA